MRNITAPRHAQRALHLPLAPLSWPPAPGLWTLNRHRPPGLGRLVDRHNYLNRPSAFLCVDQRRPLVADGVQHVGELSRVAVVADRRRVARPATRASMLVHLLTDCVVALLVPGEIPDLDVFFLEHRGSFRAVNFNPLEIARID